jgi:adenylate cyclase
MKLIGRWARRFGLARAVCVVLLFALVPLRMLDPRPIEELRLRTFDLFQVLRPREQTARPVVIIDIDEASLKEIGQWPWPRTVVADLVTRLTALGAAAIGFDAVFPEPDRMSPGLLASTLHDLDDATRERLRGLPSNDAILADAIRKSRVVLGESVSTNTAAGPAVEASGYGVITTKGAPDARTFLVYYPTLVRNLPVLEQAAAGRGIFTQVEEHDGIVRRAPVIMHAGNAFVPSLSLEMLRVATNSNSPLIRSNQNGIQSVNASRFRLPTDERGRLWIHFNHSDPRRYVSARDVLQGNVPADRIRGKLILVGTSAIGLSDNKTTPLDPVMPGVEVHAQIIESILANALLSAPSWAIGAEIIVAVVFGLAIIIAAPMLPAAVLIALGAILILGLIGLSWYFFAAHNLLIDFTYPLISSWLIYLVLTFVNYFREQKQRQQIRSAFGYYLSPPLVEQLAKSPDRLVLGGEERRMTILFSDVRGFTTISEHYKDDPQGLTQLMNRFLTPLTNAIIDRKGTIDKYIGDAIMAFWNAPLDDADHEANACDAALEMLARAEALNIELKREAETNGGVYMPLRIGIGLNSGPCVVGNMGSDFRFNYSVLGDTVNLASRLESRTKDYRLPMVIGSRTAERAKAKFATMEIDLIQVKGKKQPEVVFTVLGRAQTEEDPRCRDLRELNGQMLACYRKQQWDEAVTLLERCRKLGNGFEVAGLYDMYEERIAMYRAEPPPPDWDGVYEAESK